MVCDKSPGGCPEPLSSCWVCQSGPQSPQLQKTRCLPGTAWQSPAPALFSILAHRVSVGQGTERRVTGIKARRAPQGPQMGSRCPGLLARGRRSLRGSTFPAQLPSCMANSSLHAGGGEAAIWAARCQGGGWAGPGRAVGGRALWAVLRPVPSCAPCRACWANAGMVRAGLGPLGRTEMCGWTGGQGDSRVGYQMVDTHGVGR